MAGERRRLSLLVLGAIILLIAGCATDPRVTEIASEYYNLGNLYFEIDEYERSYEFYLKARELDPTIIAANYNLARLELERDDPQAALSLLRELEEEDEDNLLIQETIAYALNQLGDQREAETLYREILAQDPGRVSALYNLSLLTEESREAIDLLRTAADLAVEDEEILRRLISLLSSAESEESAAVYLERLRRLVADDRSSLEEVARQYEALGYPQEAVETFELLIEIDPREEEYYFSQARILLTTIGNDRNGLIALESALEEGFSDSQAIEALLGDADLVAPAQVEALLDEYGRHGELEAEEEEEGEGQEAGDPEEGG
ncbi:MAG: tetratricopeptide repeat protein [Alkalispirochaetaceae bacterium]